MGHTARTEAGKATDTGVDAAREVIGRAEDTARRGVETAQRTAGVALEIERAVARRAAEGTTEIGRAFAELAREQARHNVAVLRALSRTVDWDGVAQVQTDFVRASVERATAFTRRYLEVVQAVVASAASTAKEQARKAA
jgi:hypothetical protein